MQHVCLALRARVHSVHLAQVLLAHVDGVGDCDVVGDFGVPEFSIP